MVEGVEVTEERHLLIANTHLLALLVMHPEELDIMVLRDVATRIEDSLDVVPEGPGRDDLRYCAAALRARAPETAFAPPLSVILGGRVNAAQAES